MQINKLLVFKYFLLSRWLVSTSKHHLSHNFLHTSNSQNGYYANINKYIYTHMYIHVQDWLLMLPQVQRRICCCQHPLKYSVYFFFLKGIFEITKKTFKTVVLFQEVNCFPLSLQSHFNLSSTFCAPSAFLMILLTVLILPLFSRVCVLLCLFVCLLYSSFICLIYLVL